MLEAVALLGRALQGDQEARLKDLIVSPRTSRKQDRDYLVRLDFRTGSPPTLRGGVPEEIDAERCFAYRWVGNAPGNSPQVFLTTNKLEYLLGPATINLLAWLEATGWGGAELARALEQIKQTFYREVARGHWFLDLETLGWVEQGWFAQKLASEQLKEVLAEAAEIAKARLLQEAGVKEAALWTVCLDGKPLVHDPAYVEVLLAHKGGKPKKTRSGGICSVCGTFASSVTTELKTLEFMKWYINDKLGFASGLTPDGFRHNFSVCEDCLGGLRQAEVFARQNLNFRVGHLQFLVLPAFLHDSALSPTRRDVEDWVERLGGRVNMLIGAASVLERLAAKDDSLEARLMDYLEDLSLPEENLALLNFLFYQKAQSEFRILGLVKDVAPSRLNRLIVKFYTLRCRTARIFGQGRELWLHLGKIYSLMYLRVNRRSVEAKKPLYVYHCLLKGEPIDHDFLIREFVNLARAYLTGQLEGTNLRVEARAAEAAPVPEAPAAIGRDRAGQGEEWVLCRKLMEANLFLYLLDEEGLLKGGTHLGALPELNLSTELRAYLEEMGYDPPRAGLFLLGYLLGEVGKAQATRRQGRKPILERINYRGMAWPDIVRLSNQAMMLLQYYYRDRLHWHERTFGAAKQLLDAVLALAGSWPLKPEENVFYLLSGYAFSVRGGGRGGNIKEGEGPNGQDNQPE